MPASISARWTASPSPRTAMKRTAHAARGAGAAPRPGSLCRQQPQDRPHHGQGRRPVPALRAVRRALPHRRLGHAEIPAQCDHADHACQSIKSVNDFVVKFANVNGSGSASANEMFARSILRMGVPVRRATSSPPTSRACPPGTKCASPGHGCLGARGGVDLMVAMNPQTWDKDVASIDPGGYLFYDSSRPMPPSKFRDDITVMRVPLTEICNAPTAIRASASCSRTSSMSARSRPCSTSRSRCWRS